MIWCSPLSPDPACRLFGLFQVLSSLPRPGGVALSWLACDFATWEDLTPDILIKLGQNRAGDYVTARSQDLNLEVCSCMTGIVRIWEADGANYPERESRGGGRAGRSDTLSRALRAAGSRGLQGPAMRSFLSVTYPHPIPLKMKVKLLSHVQLFVTPWTVAYQASPSMGFSRQESWSGVPFPSPGDLPIPGIEPRSPTL